MHLTSEFIAEAARSAGIVNCPVEVHASLSSFGHVRGGARSVVDGFLAVGCTVIVTSFSTGLHLLSPDAVPKHLRPDRNAEEDSRKQAQVGIQGRAFDVESAEMNPSEGAIAAAVTSYPGRVRGNHPLNSFSAVGPLAKGLICLQTGEDVYAPLRAAADHHGVVVLMGTGLDKMTLLHAAEQDAGRAPFIQWAKKANGSLAAVRVGSCSEGFEGFASCLTPLERRTTVGRSTWRIFSAKEVLNTAAEAIRRTPEITRCAKPCCERCQDAIAGGPYFHTGNYLVLCPPPQAVSAPPTSGLTVP